MFWYNPTLLTHYFSATFRPFCAVFSPFFRGFRLPGAKTERTGEKWRKMGEIWGRNGRETAAAKERWGGLSLFGDGLGRPWQNGALANGNVGQDLAYVQRFGRWASEAYHVYLWDSHERQRGTAAAMAADKSSLVAP